MRHHKSAQNISNIYINYLYSAQLREIKKVMFILYESRS